MISFVSTWAIVIRLLRLWKCDINLLLAMFYWPALDVFMWGFLGSWIHQLQVTQLPNYELTVLLGVLLWQIISRGCGIIIASFTEEIWSNNIVSLFSLPLRTAEWIIGAIIFYAIMMTFITIFCMFIIFTSYSLPMWQMLSTFMIFWPPLFISGIWIGFTCLQIIVTLGKRGVELGYVIAWFLMPFSGAYYPIEVLPQWAQVFSYYLPMSYVFQGMRGYVMHQQDPTNYLIKGYVLSILYATCSVLLFVYCFNRSKQKGLARLMD